MFENSKFILFDSSDSVGDNLWCRNFMKCFDFDWKGNFFLVYSVVGNNIANFRNVSTWDNFHWKIVVYCQSNWQLKFDAICWPFWKQIQEHFNWNINEFTQRDQWGQYKISIWCIAKNAQNKHELQSNKNEWRI